jgi:hypothetical protein
VLAYVGRANWCEITSKVFSFFQINQKTDKLINQHRCVFFVRGWGARSRRWSASQLAGDSHCPARWPGVLEKSSRVRARSVKEKKSLWTRCDGSARLLSPARGWLSDFVGSAGRETVALLTVLAHRYVGKRLKNEWYTGRCVLVSSACHVVPVSCGSLELKSFPNKISRSSRARFASSSLGSCHGSMDLRTYVGFSVEAWW